MYPYELFMGIHLYGVCIAVGLLLCFGVLYFCAKKLSYHESLTDFIFYAAIASIAGGFFSAAVFQGFYNYLDDPSQGFSLTGGITFIGGLIGGVIIFISAYFIFRKKIKGNIIDIFGVGPCCITIAHSLGRIGCLFAGCCHGKFLGTSKVAGGIYMDGTFGWGYYVPTQLYEAIFLFILFAVLIILLLKFKFKHNMSVYLIAYGIFRFVIEYFRADERGSFIGNISPSQFWSILMVVAGIGLIFFVNYLLKKQKPTETQNEKV